MESHFKHEDNRVLRMESRSKHKGLGGRRKRRIFEYVVVVKYNTALTFLHSARERVLFAVPGEKALRCNNLLQGDSSLKASPYLE